MGLDEIRTNAGGAAANGNNGRSIGKTTLLDVPAFLRHQAD
jgi:hypothetical protein